MLDGPNPEPDFRLITKTSLNHPLSLLPLDKNGMKSWLYNISISTFKFKETKIADINKIEYHDNELWKIINLLIL